MFIRKMLFSLLVSLGISLSPQLWAGNYILNSFEPMPKANALNSSMKVLCPHAFNSNISQPRFRHSRIASMFMDKETGKMDYSRRGVAEEVKDAPYREALKFEYEKIFTDWVRSGAYTKEEVQKLRQLEASLNPLRVRLFSVEEMGGGFYSALRVYDNSKVVKHQNRPMPLEAPMDIIEQQFGISQFELLRIAGVKSEDRSWVIGLVDIRKTYTSAIQNLLSLAANRLDMHYNRREYFNFDRLEHIKNEPVNIIFFGRKKMKSFYKRVFGQEPLKDFYGNEIVFEKDGGSYQFYHYDSAQFISKFLDIKYHEPSFSSTSAMLNHKEKLEEIKKHFIASRNSSPNLEKYRADSMLEFLKMSANLFKEFISGTTDAKRSEALIGLMELRNNLPEKVFELEYQSISAREIIDAIFPLMAYVRQEIPKEVLNKLFLAKERIHPLEIKAIYFPVLAYLDQFLYDPATWILNNATEVNK